MFNPLVDDMSVLSDSDLDQKINELSRKYFMSKNPQVQAQISAILDMYKEEMLARRARQQLEQSQQNDDNDLDNLIKVS